MTPEMKAVIRPIGTKLTVELDPLETVSAGGIVMLESAVHNHMRRPDARWGTVQAVGTRCKLGLQPGQRVCINGWLNDSANKGSYARDPVDRLVIVDEADVFMVGEQEPAKNSDADAFLKDCTEAHAPLLQAGFDADEGFHNRLVTEAEKHKLAVSAILQHEPEIETMTLAEFSESQGLDEAQAEELARGLNEAIARSAVILKAMMP